MSERTAGSGVTIDGVLLKDNLVGVTSSLYSTTTSLYLGTTGSGVVYLRPSGYASATNQFSVSTTQATARTVFQVDEGAGHTATLQDAALNFTRNNTNYIRATTAGGSLQFVSNGNAESYLNALLAIGTQQVTLRHGSTSPSIVFETETYGVSVTGDLRASGEVESYDTSDIRLKKILASLDAAEVIEGLMGLRTVRYEHKHKEGVGLGLIAQDVKRPFPENIKYNDDGFLMVHYGKMVVPLVLGFQNHETRIQALEKELKELKESHGSCSK
jgi:hypothetical protein